MKYTAVALTLTTLLLAGTPVLWETQALGSSNLPSIRGHAV